MSTKTFSLPFLVLLILVFYVLGCQHEHDPVSLNYPGENDIVNPYLAATTSASSARMNPYTLEVPGGIAQNVGPVITPEGGFMVNNHYRFEEGQEFYVDIAITTSRSLVFFLTGTNIVVGKSNGEMYWPHRTTEAFAYKGVAYVWGYRNDQKFTWTIAFRNGGINHVDMTDGHIGKPVILTTTITKYLPEETLSNTSSATFEFTSNDATATFECTLDGGTPASCTSPKTYDDLGDGEHTFHVRAVRESDRDEAGASHSWTVDTVLPFLTFISTTTTSSSIQIDWTTSEPATAYLEWGLKTEPENLVPETSNYSVNRSVLLTGLRSATVYYFYIGGRDEAGNTYRSSRFSSATRR